MTALLDSAIFGPLFTDPEISEILADGALVRALTDVEKALARAEARLGVIPAAAAERIGEIDTDRIDIAALGRGSLRSGFPIIALVEELRREAGAEAAPFVHWGATTQDIMDTALVLQIRSAVKVMRMRLREIAGRLSALADRHRGTILAARTHGQQALPTSFGLKIAGWLGPLLRHAERLDEIGLRLLVVQFGGAAGTLAALGDKGLAVGRELAAELDLAAPLMPWHVQRDTLVEFAGWLSLVTGSFGKMAQDVILMSQTEIGEAGESAEAGRGGSSTMPQKSNPITSEMILAAARANGALLSALHQAQIQEHERATHGWQVEWLTLTQMLALTGGSLKHALYLASNLQVDAAAMRANIARANDLVLAEACVFALAGAMPRPKAEELVKRACQTAAAESRPLVQVVRQFAEAQGAGGAVDWSALIKPENYLGEADAIIDGVLQSAKGLLA